jgi:hypothetical protein
MMFATTDVLASAVCRPDGDDRCSAERREAHRHAIVCHRREADELFRHITFQLQPVQIGTALSCGIRNLVDEDPGGEKVSVNAEAPSDCAVTELLTRVPALTEMLAKQLGPQNRPRLS